MNPPFVAEELAELKRKDLISLCKKYDIKCVGKNSELIEKLIELNQVGAKSGETEDTTECSTHLEEDLFEKETMQMDVTETIQDEQVCVQDSASETQPSDLPCDTTPEQKDEKLDDIIKEAEKTLQEPAISDEVIVSAQLPIESPAKPAERRQSLRLSAIHKAAPANATPKAPSKLGQSFISKPEVGMKRPCPRKENVNPANKATTSNIPLKMNPLRPINKTAFIPSKPSKKPKFDIKESLKRPLTYKPHIGPLPKLS